MLLELVAYITPLVVRPEKEGVPALCQLTVVPLEVKTVPLDPIASLEAVFVPVPMIRSPVEVMGLKALKAALAEV
jgi:hypothetical protein